MSGFIINLFIYLLFFVVVSAAGRKLTTKCIGITDKSLSQTFRHLHKYPSFLSEGKWRKHERKIEVNDLSEKQ
jgi:hypothetical protein